MDDIGGLGEWNSKVGERDVIVAREVFGVHGDEEIHVSGETGYIVGGAELSVCW